MLQIHNEFQEVVDRLLTEFLEELGVAPETFYEIVAAEKDKDKLTWVPGGSACSTAMRLQH